MDDRYSELERLRDKIDQIDKTLLELFQQRMAIVIDIAEYKKKNELPIQDEGRERLVLEKTKHITNQDFIKPSEKFLTQLMAISREVQTSANQVDSLSKITGRNDEECLPLNKSVILDKSVISDNSVVLGYQGVSGSYSEQALLEYFGKEFHTKSVENFEDIFLALQSGDITYGILPIENSSTGGIAEVYDLLCKYGFYIIGEKCLSVDHHLLAPPGAHIDSIKEVFSHPQGFGQCSRFLKTHAYWDKISCSNTAVSAKMVADSGDITKAAIGSKRAGDLYGLKILSEEINNSKTNYTRFIVIGRNLEVSHNADKISMAVSIKHEPRSLYKILGDIADKGLNMLKIESRPIIGKPWEYLFYIDIHGNLKNETVLNSVESIQRDSTFFQLLGNYPSDRT